MKGKKYIYIEKILLKFPKLSKKISNYFVRNKLGIILQQIQKKITINNIYDIGAHNGEWTSFYNKTSLDNSNFILFEANKKNEVELRKKKLNFIIVVLSNKNKEVNFYDNDASPGDTYYKENTFHHENLFPKKIITDTLDNVMIKKDLPLPDFIN